MEAAPHAWPTLGVLLLRDGLVTKEDLEFVLDEHDDTRQQRISGRRLGEVLVARGLVTQVQVAELVAEQYELPFVDLDVSDIDLDVAVLMDEALSRRLSAVPISARPDGSYLLAIGDPATVLFSDELRHVLGAPPRFAVVGFEALDAAIAFVHHRPKSPATITGAEPEAWSPDGLVDELPSSGDTEPETATGPEAYFGSPRAVSHLWPPLGALLIREGLVTDAELETALTQQRLFASRRLGEILVDRGTVTRTDVARLVAEQYELPFVELDGSQIDPAAAALLSEDLAWRHSALPIHFLPDGSLSVVVADPTNVLDSDELQLALGIPLSFAVAAPDVIERAIVSFHGPAPIVDEMGEETTTTTHVDAELDLRLEDIEPVAPEHKELAEVFHLDHAFGLDQAFDLGEAAADAVDSEADAALEPETSTVEDIEAGSAVAVVSSLGEVPAVDETRARESESAELAVDELDERLERALESGVTAFHFSPQPTRLLLKARVDGVMRELETIPSSAQSSVTSWLKETTQLHLGEETIDVRVEVLPTKAGEKLTLYVLRPDSAPSSLADLGMAPDSEETLRRAIDARLGAIFFCGPTGSGKTTTFHAALRALNTPERQLTTIEDPVEQVIPGVDQVEVDAAAGVTFVRGLHAILRSDPDVLGVGEIQDEGTARLLVEAAMTDGLVLATLRARTAAAATRQLTDMGVDARLLGSALVCVLAQRLIRRVCSDCREGYYATPDELRELGRPAEDASPRLLARGRGCSTCGGTGFRGRVGIFEILPLTAGIRGLVADGASTAEIHAAAVAAGMRTLREDGIRLCLEGVTTAAEVQRVVGDRDA